MKKQRGLKSILTCFMLTSIIGMGFTGYKVQTVNAVSRSVYMEEINKENNDTELTKVLEEKKDFIEVLESKIDIKIPAFSLVAGNKKIATLKTKEEIEEILSDLTGDLSPNEEGQREIKESYILEKVDIIKEDSSLEEIKTKEEVKDYIKTGGDELQTHTIEAHENFISIGEMYGISIEDLQAMNPEIDGLNPPLGEVLTIKEAKALITLVTEEEVESIAQTAYEIEVVEDPEMYDTKSEIRVEGQTGQNKIITKHIKHNGELVKEEFLREDVITEPINQILVQGTKETPKTVATGSFDMPTRGRLSSPFGQRWGRLHRGIDIAKDHGSDIEAADGGTVTFSGVKGTYGNMIEIDHGNGYKTRYAHCSELLLKSGDEVYKGQAIAKVGSTGRSTGPHLHFEVIKNGEHQNPLNYVK